METIADYFSKEDQIKSLKHRVKMALNKRDKARASMNRLKSEKVKLTGVLAGLQLSGHLIIDDEVLADLIFVEKKAISNARSILRKENEKL